MTKQRLWIVSELFYPEQTSTGYFLTKIATGLAGRWDVHAVAAQPTYSERGIIAPRLENYEGVVIHRLFSTRLDKDSLPLRLINFLTFSFSVLWFALRKFRRGDHLLLVTNPPLLIPLIALVARIKGLKASLLVHDVYPDVLSATGMLREDSFAYRVLAAFFRWSTSGFRQLVVLGRDMQQRVARNSRRPLHEVPIITNWADVEEIQPIVPADNPFTAELGLEDRVCIQFSGNIGRTHDVQTLIEAVKHFRDDPRVRFLFIGYGGQANRLRDDIESFALSNAIFLDRQPRERLAAMLACATATVIPFNTGMKGISVPSRMYNIMAAGTPIIAMADADSELALTVAENDAGWTLASGDATGLIAVIEELKTPEGLARRDAKGDNARQTVLRSYRLPTIIDRFDAHLGGEKL
jgi:glycosyltransferase involved in cell wall biosynthesis